MTQKARYALIWTVVGLVVVVGAVVLFFGVRDSNETSEEARELYISACRDAVQTELEPSAIFSGESDGTKVTGVAGSGSTLYDVECDTSGNVTSLEPQ